MSIQEAIVRSISNNEIVYVEVDDLRAAIAEVQDEWEGETDYNEDSRGVGEGIDIFGWTHETAEGEQDFRLFLYVAK